MKKLGNNIYTIEYLDDVVKNDIPSLPKSIKAIIKRAIEERLATYPIEFGKPLRYSLKGHRRLRVGDYRVIYRIEELKKVVLVTTIKHRKDVYDD